MRTGGEGSCEPDAEKADEPRPAGELEDREADEPDERLAPRLTEREELRSRSPEVDLPSREAAGRWSVPDDPEEERSGEDFEDLPEGPRRPRRLAGSPPEEADEPEPEEPDLDEPDDDFEDEEPEDFEDEPDDFEDEDPEGDLRPRTLAGSPPEERAELEAEEPEPEDPEADEEERRAPRLTALAEPDSRLSEVLAGGEAWLAGVRLAAFEDDEELLEEPSSPPFFEDLGE
ncbi:MAG: hypothetical protein M3433_05265 [Actinomycetota bacterium]|nr:hypothetical protein [Actinomycetota bacterium]